jgi:hypothetical protein
VLLWNIPAPEAALAIPLIPVLKLMLVRLATALANLDGYSIAVMIPPSTIKPKVFEAFLLVIQSLEMLIIQSFNQAEFFS